MLKKEAVKTRERAIKKWEQLLVFSRTFPDDSCLLEVIESIVVFQSRGPLAGDSVWWEQAVRS